MDIKKNSLKDTKGYSNKAKYFIVSVMVLVIIFSVDFNINRGSVEASVSHNLSGYAWSDTIGWISFNCTDTNSCGTSDYGVGVSESNGTLFGYAWSSNIGWITFNQNELSGCPSGSCIASLSNGTLTGWAHVLSSQDAESGGWDGWISLDGDNYGVTFDENTNEFSGFAWGSAIVGWVDFNSLYGGVINTDLEVSLTVSDNNISEGDPVTITWTSTLATECSSSNFSTGNALSGNVVATPNSTTNYSILCSNSFDSAEDSKTVNVWNTECADGIDNDNDGDIDLDDLGCGSYADDNESSSEFVEMFISSSKKFIRFGDFTVITWSAEGVNSCTVDGTNGDSWTGTDDSKNSSSITEQVTYTLSCLDVEDHVTVSQSITVSLVPVFQEF